MNRVKSGEKAISFHRDHGLPGRLHQRRRPADGSVTCQELRRLPGMRAKALYNNDKKKEIRKSHENPSIKKLYEEFLEKPGSEKAHEILHTHYVKRKINDINRMIK